MATFLSIPAPLQTQPLLHHRGRPFTLFVLKPPLHKNYTNTLCRATPSPSVAEEEEAASPPQDDLSPHPQSKLDRTLDPQFRGCKTCGSEEIERGCNGEGRIQGGIATVPGFGWWPIKAYRPCPGFVASGGRYRRRGQSMDEVASGRGRREASIESSSKRRQESRDSKGREYASFIVHGLKLGYCKQIE